MAFIKCKYDSDELYDYFPHKFNVEISYSLNRAGLTQETCIHNLSNTNMPAFLGFHTTFNIPFISGASAEDICVFAEVGEEIDRDMTNYLPTGKIFSGDEISKQFNKGKFFPIKNKISKHYKADKNGRIELLDMRKRLKVVYDNDKKFGWRLFYNGSGDGFICLEPQTCMVNCQNLYLNGKDTGFDYISPNERKNMYPKFILKNFDKPNDQGF